MLNRSPALLQASHFPESATAYPALYLNPAWRVIVCRDGIQWIVQRRHGPERPAGACCEGRSYCRTREVLIRCCRAYSGEIDPAAVAELQTFPDRIEPPSKALASSTQPKTVAPSKRDRLVNEVIDHTLEAATEAETPKRAGSHISFPDRQWHPIGTINIKELGDVVGPIPDFLRRGEVPS
jgi:hypothetical protein